MKAAPRSPHCSVDALPSGRLQVKTPAVEVELHPLWLRERSLSAGAVDQITGQRLVEPNDLRCDVGVSAASLVGSGGDIDIEITFTDGHRMTMPLSVIERVATGATTCEDLPAPRPWCTADLGQLPRHDYRDLSLAGRAATDAKIAALRSFFERGFLVLTNTPAVPDALHGITAHFGRISSTNFGALFDVRTEPVAVDLAYTPVALSAHTDQPYRSPVPGLQFLHTIVNDAPGGASTMVDGLAAVDALAATDPEAHELLSRLPIEYRYDIGTDVKVGRAPMIERRPDGSLRRFRFSPRLDFAPLTCPSTLDVYYRGRRWLAMWLNDPRHQIEYRMTAGEVLVVDNHRVLHGRTSFDPTQGHRHLQGCYIDHDGPVSEWILAHRTATQRERIS